MHEVEDYDVDLDGVTALEMRIVPDISSGSTRASLAQLRLAELSDYKISREQYILSLKIREIVKNDDKKIQFVE